MKPSSLKKFTLNVILYNLLILLLLPLFMLILHSFGRGWSYPSIIPKAFTLRGILTIFHGESLKIILSSVLISLIVTIVTIILSILTARALALYNFKGKSFINILVLSPLIIPTTSVAMGLHILFIRLGLTNNIFGVILIHIIPCLPYGVRLMVEVMEIVGLSLEHQGRILGASPFKAFTKITLPLISPGIISASSLVFIVSFSQYFLTFLIGGGSVITLPIVMVPYIQSGDRTLASSYSLVFILTSLLVVFLMEKSIKNHYKSTGNFYV